MRCAGGLAVCRAGLWLLTTDVAGGASRLWTLVDVNRLDLKCGAPAGEASCSLAVLTTECR